MNDKVLLSNIDHKDIIEQDDTRVVSKIVVDGTNYLMKEHYFIGVEDVIKSTLNVKQWSGYPGLLTESLNINRASGLIDNTPKVLEFKVGRNALALVRKHTLITEFIQDGRATNYYLEKESTDLEKLMMRIAKSFRVSLDTGFMHLDPHPGNMIVDDSFEKLWFIDLECSDFNVYNKDLAYGFLCGHYYRYYAKRYIDLDTYNKIIMKSVVPILDITNNKLFENIYRLYRDNRIKKRERFSHFLSRDENNKLISKYSV